MKIIRDYGHEFIVSTGAAIRLEAAGVIYDCSSANCQDVYHIQAGNSLLDVRRMATRLEQGKPLHDPDEQT